MAGDHVRRGALAHLREIHQRADDEEQRLRVLRPDETLAGILEALLDDRISEDAIGSSGFIREERKHIRSHPLLL